MLLVNSMKQLDSDNLHENAHKICDDKKIESDSTINKICNVLYVSKIYFFLFRLLSPIGNYILSIFPRFYSTII